VEEATGEVPKTRPFARRLPQTTPARFPCTWLSGPTSAFLQLDAVCTHPPGGTMHGEVSGVLLEQEIRNPVVRASVIHLSKATVWL
jgi:hypothetical protein